MIESIYRIVHLSRRQCKTYLGIAGGVDYKLTSVCREILALPINSIITYLSGAYEIVPSVPGVTKDTKIILGGGLSDVCVLRHEIELIGHGFTRVTRNELLLFSERDHEVFVNQILNFNARYTEKYTQLLGE